MYTLLTSPELPSNTAFTVYTRTLTIALDLVTSCVFDVAMSLLLKGDGAVVVDSQSAGFVITVTTDIVLALRSDSLGLTSIFSALGVWSSSTKMSTGSPTTLVTVPTSVVGVHATVTFSSTFSSDT